MKKILLIFFLIPALTHAQYQPATLGTFIPGMDYKYYEGSFTLMPKFTGMVPIKSDTSDNFNGIPNRTQNYLFNYTGYFNAASTDIYTFYLTSDDGSLLYIDNILVVNNDGLHGAIERTGTIQLQAGKHLINVQHFNATGDVALRLTYSNATTLKRAVQSSELFRLKPVIIIVSSLSIDKVASDVMVNATNITSLQRFRDTTRSLIIDTTRKKIGTGFIQLQIIKGRNNTDSFYIKTF